MPIQERLEEHIEAEILYFLLQKWAKVDKINSEGFYNANRGVFQQRKSGFCNPGIADIVGCYNGCYFAIEVKKQSEMKFFNKSIQELTNAFYDAESRWIKGVSLKKYAHACDQRAWLDKVIDSWWVAFFASSIEEVKLGFKNFCITL